MGAFSYYAGARGRGGESHDCANWVNQGRYAVCYQGDVFTANRTHALPFGILGTTKLGVGAAEATSHGSQTSYAFGLDGAVVVQLGSHLAALASGGWERQSFDYAAGSTGTSEEQGTFKFENYSLVPTVQYALPMGLLVSAGVGGVRGTFTDTLPGSTATDEVASSPVFGARATAGLAIVANSSWLELFFGVNGELTRTGSVPVNGVDTSFSSPNVAARCLMTTVW